LEKDTVGGWNSWLLIKVIEVSTVKYTLSFLWVGCVVSIPYNNTIWTAESIGREEALVEAI